MCRNAWTFSRSPSDLVQTQHDLRQRSVSFAPPEPKPILWRSHCVLSRIGQGRTRFGRRFPRHRVRTVETAARTAACSAEEPRECPMTRHVRIQTSAAGAAPQASEPCADLVIIGTNEAAFNGATCQSIRSGNNATVRLLPSWRLVAMVPLSPTSAGKSKSR